ncbi:MAG: SpoIIE family protein phosphatase, partial [Lachnospiraceae bacterium]
RRLYEKESDHELLIRDQGYIETDPHITAMIPLYDSDGKTTAILCVQRQMETLVWVRNSYVGKVLLGLLLLLAIIILIHSFYLSKVCLKPIRTITEEASRFSKDGTLGEQRLSETIKNKDEIGVLATSIDQMEENIIQYVNDLTTITAEKERIVTELTLASKIQADKLPSIFPAFPERTEFDLYASMKPAREIGGDFYDYFLIDEDHLCLVIADVSGKGIPAALFMMSSKITISNFAKMGKSPAEIIMAANEEITETNHEEMFLTVWLGILEISTGKLTAVNAGHEYPAITEADGSFVLYRDKHGFVIGGMSGMRYKEYELNLQPGSKLFVYTDGLPEATNASEEQFGTQRMIEALNEEPDIPSQKILENVNEAVNRFVKDAEQFDDLTMLCLEYKGI